MKYIIIIFIIVLFFLLCYLFLLKKELKRIREEINFIRTNPTNRLLHSELSNKEIEKMIGEINNLFKGIAEKERKMEGQNQRFMKMMRNISHDLRTPLTSASGYVDLILNHDLSLEETKKELIVVQKRLDRLIELVDSFFEFSKILTSSNEVSFTKINIIGVIEECVGSFYEDYTKEGREIDFVTSTHKLELLTNMVMLRRIIENLIGNALKHGIGDLKIEVKESKNIEICFSNQIDDVDLDVHKMFDEFYTTDMSRTKGSTGLGLFIAKEFTTQLGGKIWALKEQNRINIVILFENN